MSQQPWSDQANQAYPYPHTSIIDNHSPERTHQPNWSQSSYMQATRQNIQPFYGVLGPAPVIAELAAPLPVAPPTTTPVKQLNEDEQLARKLSASGQQVVEDEELAKRLQLLEVDEARNTSHGSVQQRPVSITLQSSQWPASPVHQKSALSLRPHSQSVPTESWRGSGSLQQPSVQSLRPHSQSFSGVPWSPGSFGPPPQTQPRYSLLPDLTSERNAEPPTRHLPPAAISDLPEVVVSAVTSASETPSSPVSLAAYLEEHRQVPYPPQWRLDPVVKQYHAHTNMTARADWLEAPESSAWLSHRRYESPSDPSLPSYTFTFKRSGGNYRDPRFSWIMQTNETELKAKKRKSAWSYELRLDLKNGVRKTEVLNPGGKINILTTYVHAPNYDTLRFIGNDGKAYLWVSHIPLSSIHGSRYDTIRHALDRKSTRLNSSHMSISYAVFCLKKK